MQGSYRRARVGPGRGREVGGAAAEPASLGFPPELLSLDPGAPFLNLTTQTTQREEREWKSIPPHARGSPDGSVLGSLQLFTPLWAESISGKLGRSICTPRNRPLPNSDCSGIRDRAPSERSPTLQSGGSPLRAAAPGRWPWALRGLEPGGLLGRRAILGTQSSVHTSLKAGSAEGLCRSVTLLCLNKRAAEVRR